MSDQSLPSLMGWLSFACWLLVYSPQIYENYTNQSGEGVSVYFILIWMIGDLANTFGSWKQHLLPTMIMLGVYYTLCDGVLLFQIFYYRYRRRHTILTRDFARPDPAGQVSEEGLVEAPTESEPLLSRANSDSAQNSKTPRVCLMDRLNQALRYCSQGPASYFATYGLILIIGFSGWLISEHRTSIKAPELPPSHGQPEETWDTGAQIIGWVSAAAYLGSRIPQIFKNCTTKCKGLSMLFFLVGITGNLTYVMSILIINRDPAHIWINMSWLVGSAGTIFLDLVVLYQFWHYREERAIME